MNIQKERKYFDTVRTNQSKTEVINNTSINDEHENTNKGSVMIQKQELMDKVTDDMDSIVEVQRSMQELSDLMTNFSQKVVEQEEVVTNIMNDADEANINMKQAGKELKEAHEYQKGTGFLVATLYFIMAILLLIYDRVTSVYY